MKVYYLRTYHNTNFPFKAFYVLPIVAYAKHNGHKEEGLYVGWLIWLWFFKKAMSG